jgi:sugar phosphate isomerase/epimerase
LNLACCGWHTPFAAVQDEALAGTMDFHGALGNTRIIIPGLPEELRQSRDDWLEAADFFNRLSESLGARGFSTGYHNHHVEFSPLQGENPWDTLFSHTRKEVIMQLDMGNAAAGGADVLEILRRYPGRALTVHIKPYSTKAGRLDMMAGFRPLVGEDDVPWPQVFELCETVGGTEWYIVEYESDAYPPLKAVDLTLQKLRGMGK